MNEPVEIHTLDPRVVAFHRRRAPYAEIPQAIDALLAWVAQEGFAPSLVLGARYFVDPSDASPDWEVFVEVTPPSTPWTEPEPGAPFGVRELPETTVAATVHRGPLDGIREAYERLAAWVAEHGYVVAGPIEEVHVSAPDVPLPEGVTEVRLPVRAAT